MKRIRVSRAVAVAAVCVGVVLGAPAGVSAASCGGSGAPSPNPGSQGNAFYGVAATSACNAWAVGDYENTGGHYRPLIERWNGNAWKVQKSAEPSKGDTMLLGVAALSASDAWAVGSVPHPNGVMIEHWNGTAWTIQATSPLDGTLFSVAAVSPSDAWAVGEDYNGSDLQTLVEHWNGKAWTMQDSPNPGGLTGDNYLLSVTGVSASDAWAVGYYDNGSSQQTLIEHWNGTVWKVQTSPALDGQLSGVSAVSASDAWAVGDGPDGTLIEHWNGTAWKVQTSPALDGQLSGVSAVSGSDAWAVGTQTKGTNRKMLIERWHGKTWQVQKSPSPGGSGAFPDLFGVATVSANDAWAVGSYFKGSNEKTWVERWNGKAWFG